MKQLNVKRNYRKELFEMVDEIHKVNDVLKRADTFLDNEIDLNHSKGWLKSKKKLYHEMSGGEVRIFDLEGNDVKR